MKTVNAGPNLPPCQKQVSSVQLLATSGGEHLQGSRWQLYHADGSVLGTDQNVVQVLDTAGRKKWGSGVKVAWSFDMGSAGEWAVDLQVE